MSAVDVTLKGCDGSTTVTVEVRDEHELVLLQFVAAETVKASEYDCMPTMTVTEHAETPSE